jgi:RNA polymerase sigma-70 factor, ECF subfamily
MNKQDRQNLFTELITRHQGQIYACIYAVVRNSEDADDLFQSVCLSLWCSFESFRPGSNFLAWARHIAKNKVCDFVRRRPSPIHAGDKLADILMEGTESRTYDDGVDVYMAALRRCREKLAAADEELLQLRYAERLSTVDIADRMQRLRPSVSRSLNRIRRWLLECIRMELAKLEHSPRELP